MTHAEAVVAVAGAAGLSLVTEASWVIELGEMAELVVAWEIVVGFAGEVCWILAPPVMEGPPLDAAGVVWA